MALSENGVYSQLYSHLVGETMIKMDLGAPYLRTHPKKMMVHDSCPQINFWFHAANLSPDPIREGSSQQKMVSDFPVLIFSPPAR